MAANQASAPATGTATVTVACKLPHGLQLRVFDKMPQLMPVPGGGHREIQSMAPREEVYVVNGNAFEQDKAPHCQIEHGFALTRGIPKDHWDLWLKQNEKAPYVVNKMIFAYENEQKITGSAKEHEGVQTGLERIDPENIGKRLGNMSSKIETARN
jgi:hypothetical protein